MRTVLVCILLASLTGSVLAQEPTWTFTRIANTDTPIPNGSGNFTGFFAPVWQNGVVAFRGAGTGGQNGIYTWSPVSGLARLADTSFAMPGSTQTFSNFENPAVDVNGDIAFVGSGSGGNQGVYRSTQGALQRVVDLTTPTPGFTNGTFNGLQNQAVIGIDQGHVGFIGFSKTPTGQVRTGVYEGLPDGSVVRVADTTTQLPGSVGNQTAGAFLKVAVRDGDVVFGTSSLTGYFGRFNGAIQRIIDSNENLPGSGGVKFAADGVQGMGVSMRNGITSFHANTSGIYGYTAMGGVFPILDRFHIYPPFTNPIPDGGYLSHDGTQFVALGGNSSFNGVLIGNLDESVPLQQLLRTGSNIDGHFIQFHGLSVNAFDDNQFVFFSQFQDGASGVYFASMAVPEPATVLLIAASCSGVAWGMWRRRQRARRAREEEVILEEGE